MRKRLATSADVRGGVGNAIRRAVPIRTFTDWNDLLSGFREVDFVEHCGDTKIDGDFLH
ncbi:hypothetical protein [Caballeronia sp. HLA56]